MAHRIRVLLSVAMFFQFFIWGSWFVTMGTYLFEIGFQGPDIAAAYSTTGWAAIFSPLFVGMIADRYFAAQKVLGFLHLLGGVCLYWAAQITAPGAFFWVLLLYTLCYMPTLALVNSIAFRQMDDPGVEFPNVRVLGTIGWIAAGWLIGLMQIEATAAPLKIAAGASVLTGLFSFFLPHTPPKSSGEKATLSEVLGLKALSLMRERSFAVFAITSLLVTIPLAFYYNFANAFLNEVGMENAAGKMTFGQMSEIIFMVLMPLFFARLGVKKMLLIGMLAWVVRYALFALGNNDALVWMYYGGIILHGICYDFFFVTGQIYVDKKADADLRSSAQGFIALITYGVGILIGAQISGQVVQHYALADGTHEWAPVWLMAAVMAAVVAVLFAFFFKDQDGRPGRRDSSRVA